MSTTRTEGAGPTNVTDAAFRRRVRWIAGGTALLLVGLLLGRWTSPAPTVTAPASSGAEGKATIWTCSMHPEIKSPDPGSCPKCGMDLIPLAQGDDGLGPRELKLSPNAVALAEIETAPVERRNVSREVRLVGKVAHDETRLKFITAWIPGRLDRLYVDYTGTRVQANDHLVELYSPQLLTAQEELLQALQARDKLAQSESDMSREMATNTVRSARTKLRLWGLGADQIAAIERTRKASDLLTIRAPVGGIVVHKNKNTGDYVKTGERLYTISDLSHLWVELDAYESDLPWVRYGQTVAFATESYPGARFEGQIVFVAPVLTGSTRTVKVRLNVDNADGRLKPGMFVRATVRASLSAEGRSLDPSLVGKWICPMHGEVIKDAAGSCDKCGMPLVPATSIHTEADPSAKSPLVVPVSAVLWTGTRSLVYVRKPGATPIYRGQEIVLGPRAGAVYVVHEGLAEGQLVVTKGAFKIDSALQLEARPSMMLPSQDQKSSRLEVSRALLEALDPVYDRYLELQGALAQDDLSRARASAKALGTAIQTVDMKLATGPAHVAWLGLAKRLRDGAASLAATSAIAEARAAFEPLSAAILDLERRIGHASGEWTEAFCSMAFDNKGAAWLQRGTQIANPYYGSAMLRCGDVKTTFPPAGPQPAKPKPKPALPNSTPRDQGAKPTRSTAFVTALGPVYARYLEVQVALAKDDGASAKAAGAALAAAVDAVETQPLTGPAHTTWLKLAEQLRVSARAVATAKAIVTARAAFQPLSSATLKLERAFGHPDGTLVEAYCSMAFDNKGAAWLQAQTGEMIANPYFGASMLRCGDIKATFPPRIAAPTSRPATRPAESVWTCSMHPQIKRSGPGKCPLCGMTLSKEGAAGE